MDAYQQHQHYMRPAATDPYHHQQQQQQPPLPRPPVPPQGHWYSNQFQYSPSPPPPQWAPPPPPPHPHSDHFPPPGSYPPPQHHYPAHPVHQNHFSSAPPQHPPRPPLPPHLPPHPPQSYAQDWGAPNWAHHQGWEYQAVAHSNEEDWAARARAWADAKAAMENQHPESQFAPAGRVEEQSPYHDQYPHSADAHYTEIQHQSNYQQVPVSAASLHRLPATHPSEVPPVSSNASSYGPEGHLHTVRDGTSAADSNAMIQSQGNLHKSPSVHQQEVPSSYSSVTGNNAGADQLEHSYRLLSQEGQNHVQPLPAMPLADQPLEFAPRFNRDDPHIQSGYPFDSVGPVRGMDTVATMPPMNSWTSPVAPGVSYPPIPLVMPSGPQHDHALAVPSPVPGHVAPPFSSFPGTGLQPTIASSGPQFTLSPGTALHPTTAFSGDAYGIPSVSERPKKAPVPNWLKEEIKKAVITSSSLDHPKEETQFIEDEDGDKSFGKVDQEDSKSIDSSRSAEEDDDEDYVEGARTAAINQEIKRILTEVLLKVTDELFDEIATKVLNEDDLTVEVDKGAVTSNHRVSRSPPTLPTPKATAKILIPGKSKEPETEGNTEKSSSSSPGDVLGLANYATDDEDDDETQSSRSPNSRRKDVLQLEKPSEDRHDVDANGSSLVQPEGLSRNQTNLESEPSKASLIQSRYTDAVTDLQQSRKNESDVAGSTSDGRSKDISGEVRSELLEDDDLEMKRLKDNNQVKETKIRPDKNDRHESKSSGKDFQKEEESGKIRTGEKGNGNQRRHDERHSRKEKTDELNGSKDRRKEQSSKSLEKVQESESKKRSKSLEKVQESESKKRSKSLEKVQESESKKRSSHADVKEGRKETEAQRRAGAKEESNRKREHNKDKDDQRSRHKHASDSSKQKSRRSSSVSRGRNSKDDSGHCDYESSDEVSNDSKRKSRSRRRNLSPSPSPSPVKSRRRQVLRSPHSKHSQRRHSPYSSLDNKRHAHHQSMSNSGEGGQGQGLELLCGGIDDQRNNLYRQYHAVKMGLWSIWLSGFALICLSFYSTQRLPPLIDQIAKSKQSQKDLRHLGNPKITILSAPSPFTASVADSQSLAVRSWLALSSQIQVVLFSKHPSVFSFAEAFGSRVLVEPNIDFTFLGTPFFHSMMARSYSFKSDISVLVHPETVLFPDFISTLNYAHELDHDWLLVALSQNLSHFPLHLDEDGKHWRREDGKLIRSREEVIHGQSSRRNPCEGKKLMAWSSGHLPLHSAVLPPFLYGRGVHDNWIINEALSSAFRFVFDASLTISSFYLDDEDHKSYENRSWEYNGNSHLGMTYGSLFYQKSNYSDLAKLLKCDGQYTLVDTIENIFHPLGYDTAQSLGKGRILRSWRKNKRSACLDALKPVNGILDCSLMDQIKPSESLDFQFSLESLLSLIADKNKTIVLAVAGYSYKDMLMNWACRLRHLRVTNFIVCALDDETYNFSILQGLPAFRDVLAPSDISFNDCHFGTKCFQRVTKVKSRMVLEILKLGYNVLLSDVDVYWFKNPLPFLSSFGISVLPAQSDEYNEAGPINMPRRLNSGFYFARSDASTIAALEKVVKHAANSGISEQPSFYDTLCGENGTNRVGDNRCLEPETNLTVHFLDRNHFPNGAYKGLWQKKNVRAACKKKGCFVIHNNWISGRQKKLERQVSSGLWEYDMSTRMCIQTWH
ncbi:UDP-galactose:fucoside alpha-3-galactosyltransferase [Morus notabilis]|uniref:UDP-galactose:fucoside alpha-3-galactosyltransferase n=1 Tax=Morus notabilis TaxID=981085 RepID=W9S1J3_9ROSA|nr:UDP-galactose:fucoside alpha-3-galactosyltransferase [Morus notabilis]